MDAAVFSREAVEDMCNELQNVVLFNHTARGLRKTRMKAKRKRSRAMGPNCGLPTQGVHIVRASPLPLSDVTWISK